MKRLCIYFSRFYKKNKYFFLCLLALLLYIEFYKQLVEPLIIDHIAQNLTVSSDLKSDLIFGSIFTFGLLAVMIKIYLTKFNNKLIKRNISVIVAILLFYISTRLGIEGDKKWTYASFTYLHFLKYFDSIIILVAFVLLVLQKKSLPFETAKNTPVTLIEDNFFQNNGGIDLLKRNAYAKHIAQLIEGKQSSTSFVIGIKGSWGSGKSVFVRQIEGSLTKFIKIRFNPWMSDSPAEIVKDFFTSVVRETIPYNRDVSKRFSSYYSALADIDENYSNKFLSSIGLLDKLKSKTSIGDQVKEISNILKREKLRIVVFVDDLDRLDGDEILAVLKIVRNSFNFPNTFFVIAFDEDYVIKTLKEKFDQPLKFLEKIFQIEIDLPSFPIEILQDQLRNALSIDKTEQQKKYIGDAVNYLGTTLAFKLSIKTIRDVIRFANSFNHIYFKKYAEIDHIDFILLELLKLKRKNIFNQMRESIIGRVNTSYLAIESNNETNDLGLIRFVKPNAASSLSQEDIYILDSLFNRPVEFSPVKSIRFPTNALRYFSDDMFIDISYSEFDKYLEPEFFSFKALIEKEIERGMADQLAMLSMRITSFPNIQSLYNISKGLLYLQNLQRNVNYVPHVSRTIIEQADFLKSKLPVDEDRLNYFRSLFTNESTDAIAESELLKELLFPSEWERKQLITLTSDFIIELLLTNLQDSINRRRGKFDPMVIYIYQQIVSASSENKAIMMQEANTILRNYALADLKNYYSKWLVRKSYRNGFPSSEYELAPYIEQYLGYTKFEKTMYSLDEDAEILYLKSFFTKFKMNEFQPVSFDENTIEILSNEETEFIDSPDFPDLKPMKAIETDRKKSFSQKFPVLFFSKWLTRDLSITENEAIKGGVYIFKRAFNLTSSNLQIEKAICYFLVDDFLEIVVNGSVVAHERDSYIELNSVEMTKYLTLGKNEILFKVRNIHSTKEALQGDPNNNPYDFIYNILIQFKKL